MERLLGVTEAAELLGATVRFPRHLVADLRIRFVHVGATSIPMSVLEDFRCIGHCRAGRIPLVTNGRCGLMPRRRFGMVHKLASGPYQASFTGPDRTRHKSNAGKRTANIPPQLVPVLRVQTRDAGQTSRP